jgi:hypothetical protein
MVKGVHARGEAKKFSGLRKEGRLSSAAFFSIFEPIGE